MTYNGLSPKTYGGFESVEDNRWRKNREGMGYSGQNLTLVIDDVGRARVPEPRVIGGHLDNVDVLILFEHGLAVGIVNLIGAHVDWRELGDGTSDVGVLCLRGLGAMCPGVCAVRPAHPHTLLRLELTGHMEAIGLRG